MRKIDNTVGFLDPEKVDLGRTLSLFRRTFGLSVKESRPWGSPPVIPGFNLEDRLDEFSRRGIPGGFLETFLRNLLNVYRTGNYDDGFAVQEPNEVGKAMNRLFGDIQVAVRQGCTALQIFPGGLSQYVDRWSYAPSEDEDFPVTGTYQNMGRSLTLRDKQVRWDLQELEGFKRTQDSPFSSQPTLLRLDRFPVADSSSVAALRKTLAGYIKAACPCDIRIQSWRDHQAELEASDQAA